MAGSLVKSVMLEILANDGDAQAKLDAIAAKADELREENPELVARIDTAEASAKLSVFRDELKDAAASADEMAASLDAYNDAAAKAGESAARLAEVQKDDAASAEDLTAALDENASAALRSLDAQMRLIAMEEKAAAAAQESGDSQLEAGAKSREAGEESEEGAGLMAGAWEKAKLAILGIGAAVVYGVVKAASFNSIMTTLSTQAGVAKNQLGSLGSGVLDLAGQVGSDPDSLAMALYHVESSFASVGISGPKALDLLKIAAEGAAVGHADLVDTTNALDATIVAGVPGIKNYSQAMGALNAIVGSGDMTMQDLATAMGSGVMAVAKSYGQNIDQVGAAVAVFGDNNIRGAKAATDLRMAWQAVQAPIKAGIPVLQQLGLTQTTLASTMEHHGLSAAIGQFIDHLNASHVPMSDWGQLVTEIFGKKAGVGIGILIDQFGRLQSKFPDLEKGATGFQSAWQQTQAQVSQQWKDLEAGAEALAIKLGQAFLPMAMIAVRALTGIATWLTRNKAVAYALVGVVAGTLATVMGGKLVTSLSEAGQALGKLARMMGLATAATEEETAAAGGLDAAMDANPIGLIVIAVAALAAGLYELYKHFEIVRKNAAVLGVVLETLLGPIGLVALAAIELYRHWDTIWKTLGTVVREFASGPLAWLKSQLGVFTSFWDKNGAEIEKIWRSAWSVISDIAKTDWSAIKSILTAGMDVLTGMFRAGWAIITGVVRTAWSVISDLVTAAIHIVLDVISAGLAVVQGHWHAAWSDLINAASAGVRGIISAVGSLVSGFVSILFNAGRDAVQGLVNGIESMAGSVLSAVGGLASDVSGAFTSALHIFSPSKVFQRHGQDIVAGLVAGIKAGSPDAIAASMRLADGVSAAYATGTRRMTTAGAAAGSASVSGGSGGDQRIMLEFTTADSQLMTAFANAIRVRGGDPRILSRKVVFA